MKSRLTRVAWAMIVGGIALVPITGVYADDTAAPAASNAQATTHQPYSTNSPLGVLLDDPRAKTVLHQLIPSIVDNEQVDQARGMTLRQLQSYVANVLTDDMLTKIDAELAKLNAPSKE